MKTTRRQCLAIGTLVCALAMLGRNVYAQAPAPGSDRTSVTAIDILLDPDATMMKRSEAVNARLRSVYPKGFALDASHRPHITLLQRFVRTADLDQVYAAANKVLAGVKASDLQSKAFKYYYIPVGDLGLSGIVAEPTPELLKLQQDLVDAVAPFTVSTGTAGAFVTTPKEPGIQAATINYIAGWPTRRTGP